MYIGVNTMTMNDCRNRGISSISILQEYFTAELRNLDLVCWIYSSASTRGGSHSLFSPRTGILLAPADISKELRTYFCGCRIPTLSSTLGLASRLRQQGKNNCIFQLTQVSQRMWFFFFIAPPGLRECLRALSGSRCRSKCRF